LKFKNEEIINDLRKVLEKIKSSVNNFLNEGNNHPLIPLRKRRGKFKNYFNFKVLLSHFKNLTALQWERGSGVRVCQI